MERNADYIDELIGKQLTGEASPDEIAFLDAWANEHKGNRQYIEQFHTIFERAGATKAYQEFDTDAAWKKVRSSLQRDNQRTMGTSSGMSLRQLAWRMAASIIVAVGIGFAAYKMFSPDAVSPLVVFAAEEVVNDTLPDGSNVVLNRETSLSYSFDQEGNIHRVELQGEAYFEVQHNDTKTFIIDIEGVFVRDIGTSFNVKAYPSSNTIEVVVETGEVMFYTAEDSGVYLRANGKGIYNKLTKKFTIDKPEENVLAYKTRIFSFSDSDLRTVVDALNNVYPKKILIQDNLRNCHLTVSFNNEPQDMIVLIIAETLGLTVTETGDTITLGGPGC